MVAEFDQLVTTYPVWAMASALLAGIASSASPCAIAAVPLVVGYVGGYAGGVGGGHLAMRLPSFLAWL